MAIELAEGACPHESEISSYRIMKKIRTEAPPTLTKFRGSNLFVDFLSKCLIKNSADRADAMTLLTHPFIVNNSSSSVLQPLIKEFFQRKSDNNTNKNVDRGHKAESIKNKNNNKGKVEPANNSPATNHVRGKSKELNNAINNLNSNNNNKGLMGSLFSFLGRKPTIDNTAANNNANSAITATNAKIIPANIPPPFVRPPSLAKINANNDNAPANNKSHNQNNHTSARKPHRQPTRSKLKSAHRDSEDNTDGGSLLIHESQASYEVESSQIIASSNYGTIQMDDAESVMSFNDFDDIASNHSRSINITTNNTNNNNNIKSIKATVVPKSPIVPILKSPRNMSTNNATLKRISVISLNNNLDLNTKISLTLVDLQKLCNDLGIPIDITNKLINSLGLGSFNVVNNPSSVHLPGSPPQKRNSNLASQMIANINASVKLAPTAENTTSTTAATNHNNVKSGAPPVNRAPVNAQTKASLLAMINPTNNNDKPDNNTGALQTPAAVVKPIESKLNESNTNADDNHYLLPIDNFNSPSTILTPNIHNNTTANIDNTNITVSPNIDSSGMNLESISMDITGIAQTPEQNHKVNTNQANQQPDDSTNIIQSHNNDATNHVENDATEIAASNGNIIVNDANGTPSSAPAESTLQRQRMSHIRTSSMSINAATAASGLFPYVVVADSVRNTRGDELARCCMAIANLTRADVMNIKKICNNSNPVKMAIESVAIVLGAEPIVLTAKQRQLARNSIGLDYWTNAQALLSKVNFLRLLSEFDFEKQLTPTVIDKLHYYAQFTDIITPEQVTKSCEPAGIIWRWVLAIYDYALYGLGYTPKTINIDGVNINSLNPNVHSANAFTWKSKTAWPERIPESTSNTNTNKVSNNDVFSSPDQTSSVIKNPAANIKLKSTNNNIMPRKPAINTTTATPNSAPATHHNRVNSNSTSATTTSNNKITVTIKRKPAETVANNATTSNASNTNTNSSTNATNANGISTTKPKPLVHLIPKRKVNAPTNTTNTTTLAVDSNNSTNDNKANDSKPAKPEPAAKKVITATITSSRAASKTVTEKPSTSNTHNSTSHDNNKPTISGSVTARPSLVASRAAAFSGTNNTNNSANNNGGSVTTRPRISVGFAGSTASARARASTGVPSTIDTKSK
jgi:hypothetical protein